MLSRAVAWRLALALVVVAALGAASVAASGVSAQRRSRHGLGHALGHGHRRAKHAVDKRPPDLSRYHSTAQLIDEFRALQSSCPHLTVGTRKGAEKELVTVQLRRPGQGPATEARFAQASERLKVLMFFGEHARELISPETALRFTQLLCGVTPSGHAAPNERELQRIARVVDNADVLLFPVINADGHAKVVSGSYCTRTNARGVDLNRNWDEHWKRSHRADTNGGARAFSEDEVRILRDAATDYNPDMFVSIHSGALGMYTPYAYSTARPSGAVEQQMVGILKGLNPHFCNCDVGAAGKELNYLCPGTCLDYVFDKLQTPYAFAVEIWEGGYGFKKQPRSFRSPFQALLQTHERDRSHHTHSHAHSHAHAHGRAAAKAARAAAVPHEPVPAATADALKLGSCFLLSEQQRKQQAAAADANADADADADGEAAAEEDDVTAFVEVEGEAEEAEAEAEGAAVLFPPPKSNAAHTCLSSFNPTNPTDYIATTDNWAHALTAMIDRVLDTDHRAPKRD